MTEYLNVQNVTAAMVALLTAWELAKLVLRVVKDRTATTWDNAAYDAMISAEQRARSIEENEWVRSYAPAFWAQVEAQSLNQKLPSLAKLAMFLKLAHDGYVAAKGKTLSAESVKTLEMLAGGLSASAKLPLAANPQPAPVSR